MKKFLAYRVGSFAGNHPLGKGNPDIRPFSIMAARFIFAETPCPAVACEGPWSAYAGK